MTNYYSAVQKTRPVDVLASLILWALGLSGLALLAGLLFWASFIVTSFLVKP